MNSTHLTIGLAVGAAAAYAGWRILRSSPPPEATEPFTAASSEPPTGLGYNYDPAVAPAIVQLLKQINVAFPVRSKASDGTLPSAAHHAANPNSDHDRGDALDVTYDPLNGPNLEALAAALLKDERVTYVIWQRRIANRSIMGGQWRPYALTAIQTDPHTSHLHVSVNHGARSVAAPWDLSGVTQGTAVA